MKILKKLFPKSFLSRARDRVSHKINNHTVKSQFTYTKGELNKKTKLYICFRFSGAKNYMLSFLGRKKLYAFVSFCVFLLTFFTLGAKINTTEEYHSSSKLFVVGYMQIYSGIRKSRCKSAATAITVTEPMFSSRNAYRSVRIKVSWANGEVSLIRAGFLFFGALRGGRFCFILLLKTRKGRI